MAKKLIAVVPLWDDEKESIWMLPGYMNGIEAAGGIPLILPLAGAVEDALE
ncbi:MAG: gamma-glutamyl-gamma-aminobutyrate hydrolase family protein, partial [Clostridiales bacterium]|nr:gamma-glutamyl-gamma-aminobutyrate hydrolase family protein [Clostridiales bacterium]